MLRTSGNTPFYVVLALAVYYFFLRKKGLFTDFSTEDANLSVTKKYQAKGVQESVLQTIANSALSISGYLGTSREYDNGVIQWGGLTENEDAAMVELVKWEKFKSAGYVRILSEYYRDVYTRGRDMKSDYNRYLSDYQWGRIKYMFENI